MRKSTANIAILLVLCAAMLVPGTAEGSTAARGDFEFFLDTATFRLQTGGLQQDLYIRISNSGLAFSKRGPEYISRTKLTIRIVDADAREKVNEILDVSFSERNQEDAYNPVRFQTLIKTYNLEPGSYRLSVALMDIQAPKKTLMGMVRKKYNVALIKDYPLDVPEFSETDVSLSDPMYLWSIEHVDGRTQYHPNPSRLFGLYLDTLQVYIEAYVPVGYADIGRLNFQTVILDTEGEVVERASIPLPARKSPPATGGGFDVYPIVIREDLTRFPAGAYSLYVSAGIDEGGHVNVPCGKFAVAWDMRTWELSRKTYLSEARFLLGDDDYDTFKTYDMGKQETMLQEVWKEHDPDPSTGANEAYDIFLERLAFVSARYASDERGAFSDRGLTYLRYGIPDEMVVDVIPVNRETTAEAFETVKDRFQPVSFARGAGSTTLGRNIIIDPRQIARVGEGGNTAFPFELWIYNGGGKPLLKRDMIMEQGMGMRFIFVDREGFGRYKLESSSTMAPK